MTFVIMRRPLPLHEDPFSQHFFPNVFFCNWCILIYVWDLILYHISYISSFYFWFKLEFSRLLQSLTANIDVPSFKVTFNSLYPSPPLTHKYRLYQGGGIKIPQYRPEFGKLAVIILASCVESMTGYLNCPSGMKIPPERERNEIECMWQPYNDNKLVANDEQSNKPNPLFLPWPWLLSPVSVLISRPNSRHRAALPNQPTDYYNTLSIYLSTLEGKVLFCLFGVIHSFWNLANLSFPFIVNELRPSLLGNPG